eukprot:GAFH01002096.1.p2 GENE.GAFH01002096.1~~GAFH01002096.1.p2  ORF type:complete len:215 (-),score=0.26 GAFH01002096.1:647-1261(-)
MGGRLSGPFRRERRGGPRGRGSCGQGHGGRQGLALLVPEAPKGVVAQVHLHGPLGRERVHQLEWGLFVVPHPVDGHLHPLHRGRDWAAEGLHIFGGGPPRPRGEVDSPEEGGRGTVRIHSSHRQGPCGVQLGRHPNVAGQLKDGRYHAQLSHDNPHQAVALAVDPEGRLTVQRGPLQIADHQFATMPGDLEWHIASGTYCEAGA